MLITLPPRDARRALPGRAGAGAHAASGALPAVPARPDGVRWLVDPADAPRTGGHPPGGRTRCGATHSLWPDVLVGRRMDLAELIGAALAAAADGAGHRLIATRLGLPAATVRGGCAPSGASQDRWALA